MGQFHIDFDIIDDNGEKVKGLKEICSTESYLSVRKYIMINYHESMRTETQLQATILD